MQGTTNIKFTHTHTHTHTYGSQYKWGKINKRIETAVNAACQRFVRPSLDRPSYVLPGDFQTNTMGHSIPFAKVILQIYQDKAPHF